MSLEDAGVTAPKVPYTGHDPVIFTSPPARSPVLPAAPARPEPRQVEITIDGEPVTVAAGTTILQACRAQGIDIPTLCQGDTVTPRASAACAWWTPGAGSSPRPARRRSRRAWT